MKNMFILSACLLTWNIVAGDITPIHLGYDRRPVGREKRVRMKWYSDINRLTLSGFPFVKVPDGKKELKTNGLTASTIKKLDCVYLIGGADKKTASMLRKFVADGGGLVVMGLCNSELADIIPVKLLGDRKPSVVKSLKDAGFKLVLTDTKSALTRLWRKNQTGLLIPNRGSMMRVEIKKNTKLLAEFIAADGKRYPALVEGSFGKGKVVYFAGCLDRNLRGVSKIFGYALNNAWQQHPLWDATVLTWLATVARRADVVKLIYDYQEYMYGRAKVFNRLHALLAVNDIIRIDNQQQADQQLAAIKNAFWTVEKIDRIVDRYKIAEGAKKLKKLYATLPQCSRIVKPGPRAKNPADKNFFIDINMDDSIYLQGAYNQDFLVAYHQKLQHDFGGVIDAMSPYIHPYQLALKKSLLKSNPAAADFDFNAISSIAYSSASLNSIPCVIQQTFTRASNSKYSFSNNKQFRKVAREAAEVYSPLYDPWTKPFYTALGKYVAKETIVTGVEFLNEPSLRDKKNKRGKSVLNNDFREWLKTTYGTVNKLNRRFPLDLKSWDDLPDYQTIAKRLKDKKFAKQGRQLSTANGINWQICPIPHINSFKKLKTVPTSKWKKIVVPEYFEGTVGDDDGVFWYKAVLEIKPGEIISFTGIDDNAKVYVKGECVASNTGYNTPFNVHIPLSLLDDSGKVNLYVRVEDTGGKGGIYGRVFVNSLNPDALSAVVINSQLDKDRLFWGLWGDFLTAYQVDGCRKLISWIRKETSKPVIDRSRGSTFDAWVPLAEMSKLVDVFGAHVSPSFALDYAYGMNFSKYFLVSEYYPAGYGSKDPETDGAVVTKQFWGAFYRYHPRAAYREAGLAAWRFWETVARGINGIGMFSPMRYHWNSYANRVPGIRNLGRLTGYYRFEPRTGYYIAAKCANYYKHIYPVVRDSKPDHKLYIYVSPGSIKQSQLGNVNNQHPLKMEARALYNFLTEDIGEQVGVINAGKIRKNWTGTNLHGRVIFIPYGEFFGRDDLQVLKDLVKRGGTVVAFGPLGLYDGYGRNMAELSSELTNLDKIYKVNLSKKMCYTFTVKNKVKPLITGPKSTYLAYHFRSGAGSYYQFGVKPTYIKRPKGFDNVDEAWLKNKASIEKTSSNLYYIVRKAMVTILEQEQARSGFSVKGIDGKIFIRKKDKAKLLFIFNTGFLKANKFTVTFPEKYQVELLYDRGVKKLGKLQFWRGSISPGGCRILRLTR